MFGVHIAFGVPAAVVDGQVEVSGVVGVALVVDGVRLAVSGIVPCEVVLCCGMYGFELGIGVVGVVVVDGVVVGVVDGVVDVVVVEGVDVVVVAAGAACAALANVSPRITALA